MPNTLHVAKLITAIRWHHLRMKKITTINIHPGDWRQSRFRTAGTGTAFFCSHLPEKRFFFVTAPAKKHLGKKKTGWKRGTFWKKSTKKPTRYYSKFSAKVTSWKYRVTKGGSPGHLILDPGRASRWVHSDWKINLTRTFVSEFSFRYLVRQKFF